MSSPLQAILSNWRDLLYVMAFLAGHPPLVVGKMRMGCVPLFRHHPELNLSLPVTGSALINAVRAPSMLRSPFGLNTVTFNLGMPKHTSTLVCSTPSVLSGAIPSATKRSRPVPETADGKILQWTALEICWLLIHFLSEVIYLQLSHGVCLVWVSLYCIRYEFSKETTVQVKNDNFFF